MGVHFSAGFHRAKDPTLPSNMKFLLVVAFIGSAKAIETVGLHQQTPVQYGSQIGPVLYGALGEDGLVSESRTLPDEAGPKMSALPTSGLATVTKTLKPAQPLVYRPNPYVYIPAIGQVAKSEETVATNPFVYTSYNPTLVARMGPPPFSPVSSPFSPTLVAPARAPAPSAPEYIPTTSDQNTIPEGSESDKVLAPGYIPTIVVPARAPAPSAPEYIPTISDQNSIPEKFEVDPVVNVEPRTVPEGLKPVATNPFVYTASPYVYAHHMNPVHPNQITPIVPHGLAYSFTSGQANVVKVPKPEETLVNAELRTVTEDVNPVATNPFVYTASPYVYAHPMNPVHPTQLKPIVPHGFAYSFTVGNENVPAQTKDVVSM